MMNKPAVVIEYRKPPSIQQMACTVCGATADASCNCGAPYLPRQQAAEAVRANPEKSNRAIAAEINVHPEIVRRARTDTGVSVDERVGLDGKTRKMPRRKHQSELVMPTDEEADESYQSTLYDQACLLLESMAGETRQKFFAHLRRKYCDQI